MSVNRIVAAVGSASVTVIGGSTTAVSIGTILVATGGAAALGLVGYGVYRWLSSNNAPKQLPMMGTNILVPNGEPAQLS